MDMNTEQKSEEQIAKDKEAVARMIGAKTAMEAAQRRIETLELALKTVRFQCEQVGKAFSDSAHFYTYNPKNTTGGWEVRKARDIFSDIDVTIGKVL